MAEKVLIILGPTASGKTRVAIEAAQRHNSFVISADSRQVYAGLNVGTAKPREAWHSEVHAENVPDAVKGTPHYLLNVAWPSGTYTLAQWKRQAEAVLASNLVPGSPAVVAGGTMLYLDSLIFNYDIPQVPARELRRRQLAERPAEELYQLLMSKDPEAKEFVEPHHTRRIIRALEVIEATGKPFSAQREKRTPWYDYQLIGLFPGWDQLRTNITLRVQQMINDGLIEETRGLETRYGSDLPLLHTIHYAQALKVGRGTCTLLQAQADMVGANMRYARRQMNWWKRNKNICWCTTLEDAVKIISS